MSEEFSAEAYVRAMAPIARIKIEEEWMAVVVSHIDTAKKMADITGKLNIDEDSIDLANTYFPK